MTRAHGSTTLAWRTRRGGAVLLEAMIALAVLGTVAGTAAWHTRSWIHAVDRAHAAERDVREAQRLMTAVSLWPVDDLEDHLGATRQGRWRLHVEREDEMLFEIVIEDTVWGAPVLRTTLFRDPPEDR